MLSKEPKLRLVTDAYLPGDEPVQPKLRFATMIKSIGHHVLNGSVKTPVSKKNIPSRLAVETLVMVDVINPSTPETLKPADSTCKTIHALGDVIGRAIFTFSVAWETIGKLHATIQRSNEGIEHTSANILEPEQIPDNVIQLFPTVGQE